MFCRIPLPMTLKAPPCSSILSFKFSLFFLFLIVKKDHHYCWWNRLIFNIKKIWSPSFFHVFHVLHFYNNHLFSSELFPTLITHTQQVVSMFCTTYHSELLFSKMKHVKSTLCGWYAFSAPPFNLDITFFCDCKHQMSH